MSLTSIDTCDLVRVHGGQQIPGQIDPVQAAKAGVDGAKQGSKDGGDTGETIGRVATMTNPLLRKPAEYVGRKTGEVIGGGVGFVKGAAKNVRDQVRSWLPW